jgi:hypothetical protein
MCDPGQWASLGDMAPIDRGSEQLSIITAHRERPAQQADFESHPLGKRELFNAPLVIARLLRFHSSNACRALASLRALSTDSRRPGSDNSIRARFEPKWN